MFGSSQPGAADALRLQAAAGARRAERHAPGAEADDGDERGVLAATKRVEAAAPARSSAAASSEAAAVGRVDEVRDPEAVAQHSRSSCGLQQLAA